MTAINILLPHSIFCVSGKYTKDFIKSWCFLHVPDSIIKYIGGQCHFFQKLWGGAHMSPAPPPGSLPTRPPPDRKSNKVSTQNISAAFF